jgi:hypothetical protein
MNEAGKQCEIKVVENNNEESGVRHCGAKAGISGSYRAPRNSGVVFRKIGMKSFVRCYFYLAKTDSFSMLTTQ